MIRSEPTNETRANATITLRGLIAARWILLGLAVAGAALVGLVGARLPAGLAPRSEYGLGLALTCVLWAALNLFSALLVRRGQASEAFAGLHLIVDALALTVLLALSGGPANPFTILYFVPITLATQVSPRWTWALAGLCVACFAGLFVLTPMPPAMTHAHAHARAQPSPETLAPEAHTAHDEHAGHAGHAGPSAPPPATLPSSDRPPAPAPAPSGHSEHFEGHQRGMWVAFGLAGLLITIVVHRTALALATQREELTRLRQAALEDRHLTALGALAAGAAHELGTPLATIRLLVDELPHLDSASEREARATMAEQLERCKQILARMASPELRIEALGGGEAWPLSELLATLDPTKLGLALELDLPSELPQLRVRQPLGALSQLLRELIRNAAQAMRHAEDPSLPIHVRMRESSSRLQVAITDRGKGMDAETLAAAFTPFHTTRPEGEGMGLGLYLARAHLRQLGGTIALDSQLGRGTRVEIELPLEPPVSVPSPAGRRT